MNPKDEINKHWDTQRAEIERFKESGMVLITFRRSRLLVTVPDLQDFPTKALNLGGRFRHRTGRWSFPRTSYKALKTLCESIWGIDKVRVR